MDIVSTDLIGTQNIIIKIPLAILSIYILIADLSEVICPLISDETRQNSQGGS